VIFVTVGSQVPFDRLVRAVDAWAASHPGHRVVAQVGVTDFAPRCMEVHAGLPPEAYQDAFAAADVVVGHAGMGTIITAFELGKHLLIMPRRAALGEHRNDHQLATVERVKDYPGIAVAMQEDELAGRLDELLALDPPERQAQLPGEAKRDRLIDFLRATVDGWQ